MRVDIPAPGILGHPRRRTEATSVFEAHSAGRTESRGLPGGALSSAAPRARPRWSVQAVALALGHVGVLTGAGRGFRDLCAQEESGHHVISFVKQTVASRINSWIK